MITIDELLNMMAVFIEIGEGKDHKVGAAKGLLKVLFSTIKRQSREMVYPFYGRVRSLYSLARF